MSRRNRRAWLGLWIALGAGAVGLTLLTRHALTAARTTAQAAVEAQHEEDLRTALYRMDQRFLPLLARAVARTEREGFTRGPLQWRVELETGLALPDTGPAASAELAAAAEQAWNEEPELQRTPLTQNDPPAPDLAQWQARGQQRSQQEFNSRVNLQVLNNGLTVFAEDVMGAIPLRAGPLVPAWEGAADARMLLFARRIQEQATVAHQLFRVDWAMLEQMLLAEVSDLFLSAALEPVDAGSSDGAEEGDRLASLPARLRVPAAPTVDGADAALRSTLLAAWVLALIAALAGGLALRASLADADRQRRFTSAVTHELRTPLTTFRLYSEMLAKEMVPPERRAEYLRALEDEAARLGSLVENVLVHARLEEGRGPQPRETVTVGALLARHQPALERRCERAGAALACELGEAGEAVLETDVEAVGQVLANLVDNACKYGAPEGGHHADPPLRLTVRLEGHEVVLTVADHGEGIPAALAARIFQPFDRGGRDEGDAAPGVGLGLALCRDLARSLGGSLTLGAGDRTGADFELRLPCRD